jgi:hypothetical protein
MYTGRIGYGAALPYSLGERSNAADNLAGVAPSGHGVYLGNIFDELSKIAKQVGIASDELAKVADGKSKIATVPTDQATITFPVPGSPIATSIPLFPLLIGVGALIYFTTRKRR